MDVREIPLLRYLAGEIGLHELPRPTRLAYIAGVEVGWRARDGQHEAEPIVTAAAFAVEYMPDMAEGAA